MFWLWLFYVILNRISDIDFKSNRHSITHVVTLKNIVNIIIRRLGIEMMEN